MGFPFSYICDLLDALEKIHVREIRLLPKVRESRTKDTIVDWFRRHKWRIDSYDTDSYAVLRILKPERLIDREYGLENLAQTLGKIFDMPSASYERFKQEESPYGGDLGSRLCQIMTAMRISPQISAKDQITADKIDQTLLRIASYNSGSSATVRSLAKPDKKPPSKSSLLEELYSNLQPEEAKWLTRIIQKDFGEVTLPDNFDLGGQFSGLPNIFKVAVQFPTSGAIALRREDSGITVGESSVQPLHPLPTPPTSASTLPAHNVSVITAKPAPRFRVTLDPTTSQLAAPVQMHTISTPTSSSANCSSAAHLTAAVEIQVPPTPAKSSPLPHLTPTKARSVLSNNRKRRRSSASTTPARSNTNSQRHSQLVATTRPVLSLISLNVSTCNDQHCQSASSNKQNGSAAPATCESNQPSPSPVYFGTGKCTHETATSKMRCHFSGALLILSPFIARTPDIIRNLISPHGAHFITSLSHLSHSSVPRHTNSGRRIRKFLLVEIGRPEETIDFCKRAERKVRCLKWKCERGYPERIPILDWRVLEDFKTGDGERMVKYFLGTI
ncbi:ATP dependent DNA ligase domain protein [Diplocarpon rosae]|nr:ATP dependent DNA ligase domain protein [Diplocarpon rosae]